MTVIFSQNQIIQGILNKLGITFTEQNGVIFVNRTSMVHAIGYDENDCYDMVLEYIKEAMPLYTLAYWGGRTDRDMIITVVSLSNASYQV